MNSSDSHSVESSWWCRPAGGREVLQVALPMVVSTISWTVMTYVDRALLAQYSPNAMAAAFTGGVVWFALFCLFVGICSYVNTFVSQYHGDDQPERIAPVVWQGNWLALASVPLAAIALLLAEWVFQFTGHSAEITKLEVRYFRVLCWGGPGMALATSFACFYSGRGMTWVTMLVDLGATVLNLALDVLLIFGYWGFPEMGIAGAALGTVTALWVKPFVYFALMRRPQNRVRFGVDRWHIDATLLKRLVYYGGPGGVQMLLDVAGFTVFIVLIGRLGALESQASSMAFSVNSVSFMPVWGLGMAAGILVGQHLGENRDDLAARAAWTTYQVAMAYMGVLTVLYVAWPDLFLTSFFGEAEYNASLYAMAVRLLYFVAVYNAFDTTQIVFVSALKGSGDTRFIMLVSLVMALLLAGFSILAVEILHLNVYSCWCLIVLWLIAAAMVYLLRFLQGKWRTMRVIELVHHVDPIVDETPALIQNAQPLVTSAEEVS